jgi:hypothetical protein
VKGASLSFQDTPNHKHLQPCFKQTLEHAIFRTATLLEALIHALLMKPHIAAELGTYASPTDIVWMCLNHSFFLEAVVQARIGVLDARPTAVSQSLLGSYPLWGYPFESTGPIYVHGSILCAEC